MRSLAISVIIIALCCPNSGRAAEPAALRWQKLSSLPDKEGFAGMAAGVSGEALIAAGGANFPNGCPWEGGSKVWYDDLWVLKSLDGAWQRRPERLPRLLGYAVSVTYRDAVIIAGGETPNTDGTGSHAVADVLRLRWDGSQIITEALPPLPQPTMNANGVLVGPFFYVIGGTSGPTATSTYHAVWSMNLAIPLDEMEWVAHPKWPGPPRMLAVTANWNGELFLCSGVDLHADAEGKPARTYLTDAYHYSLEHGWRKIAAVPRAVVAAGAPAPVDDAGFLIVSGDDASQLSIPVAERTGFPATIWKYEPLRNRWSDVGKTPAPRVTLPVVMWQNRAIFISGEQRPGVRSPEVWSLNLSAKD
ncbi:galactose oxidase [bacterium]|nr:galactose oxidase [bacterium]